MNTPAQKPERQPAEGSRASAIAKGTQFLRAFSSDDVAPVALLAKKDRDEFEEVPFGPTISLTDARSVLFMSDGKGLAIVKETTKDTAQANIDAIGVDPSAIVRAGDGRIALIWRFAAPQKPDDNAARLIRAFTGREWDNQCAPIPGFAGADYQYVEDESTAHAEGGFPAYAFDDLMARVGRVVAASSAEGAAPEPEEGSPAPVKPASGEPSTAKGDTPVKFDPTRWPHVELIGGDLSPELLSIPLVLAMPKNHEDKRVNNYGGTFGKFLDQLCTHVEGPKDGLSWLQGKLNVDKKTGGPRKKGAMLDMFVMGMDIDTGAAIEPIIENGRNLGLALVAYTTNSHMSAESTFLVDAMWQYAANNKLSLKEPEGVIRHFMTHKKPSWEPHLIDTIRFVEQRQAKQDKDGPVWVIKHAPIPRHRLAFPLRVPVTFNIPGMRPQDLQKQWGKKIQALAAKIGAPIDEACLDPSRLFYLGRHKKGAPFRVIVVNGKPLDYDAIEIPTDEKVANDTFAAAGRDMGARDAGSNGDATFKDDAVPGFSFKKWASLRGHRIDFTRMLIDKLTPDQVRHEISEDQIEIECPFDSSHSNVGNTDDRACCVWNPDLTTAKPGYGIACQHQGCKPKGKPRDRLSFTCKMVTSGWLTTDDLENDEYILDLKEGEKIESAKIVDPAETAKCLIDDAETLVKRSPTRAECVELLTRAANADIPGTAVNTIKATLTHKGSPLSRSDANAIVREGKDAISARRQEERDTAADTERAALREKGIVVIDTGDDHHVQCDKALAALREYHAKAQGVFNVGDGLARLIPDRATGTLTTQALNDRNLPNVVRNANTRFWDEEKGRHVALPPDVNRDILAEVDNGFPDLKGIARTSFFALDQNGAPTLVSTPGYHAPSGYYYAADDKFVVPAVSEDPSPDDIRRAKWMLLDDVFGQIPFDGDADKAHLLCMLLQFFMRALIDGPTPIYSISKPMRGTGAGILFDSVAIIATGDKGASHTYPKSDEESGKSMLSVLRKGSPYYWVDNILKEVDSDVYATCATSGFYAGRLLYSNTDAQFPIRFVWVMSGNHLKFSDEMARRTAPIFLDAKRDPLEREDFAHPDLLGYVREHRAELVWACLTLVKAWVVAGMPKGKQKPRKSFEAWSAAFGGLLETIGVPGFLENCGKVDDEANGQRDALIAFMTQVAAGGIGQKYKRKVGNPDDHANLKHPEWHGENSWVLIAEECGVPFGGNKGAGKMSSLGSELRKYSRNVFPITVAGRPAKVMFHSEKDTANGGHFYYLEPAREEAASTGATVH